MWWPGVVLTYKGVEVEKSALLEVSGTHTSLLKHALCCHFLAFEKQSSATV